VEICVILWFELETHTIGDDVYSILESKEVLYRDKIKLCMYFTDIKNIFRVYDEEIAIELFETLLNDFDAIPSVLQKRITEKIIPDSGRLTNTRHVSEYWHILPGRWSTGPRSSVRHPSTA